MEVVAISSLFEIPVEKVKGVGEKIAQLLHKLDIYSVGQLISYYPRSYEDWSNPQPITPFLEGTVLIKAKLLVPFSTARITGGRIISNAMIGDDSGSVNIVYFNNKYISTMIKEDEEYYFHGKIERTLSGLKMISPTFSPVGQELGLHPVYTLTSGLSNKQLQRFVKEALKLLPEKVNDPLPEFIRKKYNLSDLRKAIVDIHFPKTREDMEKHVTAIFLRNF